MFFDIARKSHVYFSIGVAFFVRERQGYVMVKWAPD